MCGIVGMAFSEPRRWDRGLPSAMTDSLAHRGPDSAGLYRCPSGWAWMGFRRLAIRDLDPRADQPMRSASGRTWIAFNGEIYNTRPLARRFLSGARLRTSGDTEVLLEAVERYGDAILPELNGMFAAAVYNEPTQTLTLIRDRMGKKPLYLYEGDGFLAFASELRAFRAWPLEADPDRAAEFLHFGYVPSPRAFFKRTSQLRPGEAVVIRRGRIISRQRFFDFAEWPWGETGEPDLDRLDRLLADAVSIRTISDVPVGAFLSGGVDSSLVAAQLRASGHDDVPTFTVAFNNPRYDEAPHAARLARRLGLPHTAIPVDERRLPELVADFLDCYEQPYADSSGLPSMLLCREVKQHVTVALSGDGGDEFFGGYMRYGWYRKALRVRRLPGGIRRLIQWLAPHADRRRGQRIVRWLEAGDEAALYAAIIRCWTAGDTGELLPDVRGADDAPAGLVRDVFARLRTDALSKAACFDACHYIPDDLQVKMDRASMRVALEVRCPLLDGRVAQFGARLTTAAKYRRGGKSVLKQLLARHVPRGLFERPKQGFGVPMAEWLRGPLRDAVRDALSARSFRECGWLNTALADRLWDEFQRGHAHRAGPLWMLFVLSRSMENTRALRLERPSAAAVLKRAA